MKKQVSVVLIFALIFTTAFSSTADKLGDKKRQKNSIENKISSISKQKKKEQSKLKSAIDDKNYLTSQQKNTNAQYKSLSDENERLQKEIDQIQDAVDEAEENYKKQDELFKTRLKIMYETASYGKTNTLLKSKNVTDFFARLKYIQAVSNRDKQLIDDVVTAKNDIEYKKQLKEKMKLDKEKKIDAKKKQIENIKASRADLDEQIRQINDKLDKLDEQEDELIKKSDELTSQIKALQSKGKYIGGSMIWPVPSSGLITSYYGMRFHPVLKKYKMHTGIDIGASSGVSILAANKGVVIVAGWESGYGNTVIIDHGGGVSTLYAHSSRLLVSVGDKVNAGEVIAKVGSTGLSTGPHLHFEVRKNGATADPTQYVRP
ncbi:MAG: peptidoglycan DD-metalloendopeptidase family protein [Bacillota bacterium]|nr:peptidoglycan DD-metalloendopeptidase family protein [Bacillota bacterium]